ncbi:MAG: endonuclease III, partial [Gemmatimonadetes bacterium]|nr:endonuclease III [Gemmatimonadota bacterium]
MKDRDIHQVISILEDETSGWTETALTLVAEQTRRDPFRILIGTVLSLRTKDETTAAACERLFGLADTPAAMRSLPEETVDRAIYPGGFHATKARNILQ